MAETLDSDVDKDPMSGAISAPNLTRSLKPRNRAIANPRQARNIVRTLEQARREHNIKNARIMSKYNSERPYTQSELESQGLGWKSNFTTKPLPMLIDKVAPRFVKLLDGMKYLTNSKLPESYTDADVKTDAFRREISNTVRGRAGWSDFVSDVAMENALFGYTSVAWLDEFTWFPKHFRQDCFFVPTGTKQAARTAQVICLRETFLVHELFDIIHDKEAAEIAGWDIANTVFAINRAMPENRRSKEISHERIYEDLLRESNSGASHESGALVVTVWHVLATEVTGKVSHYVLDDNDKVADKSTTDGADLDVLFEREDQFANMAECASFFSFQHGNGKLHGSKGIGREIYSMAAMLDRARNEVVDRLNLSGKMVITGDSKQLRKFKMSVVGNALLIGNEFAVQQHKIDAGVEEFLKLDQFLTQHLDQMSGATTPKAFEGERVTKAAVELFASREEESRDNISGRFLSQFATMMTTMQTRLCDSDTVEDDAKEMQKRLLEVMSRKELNYLAKQPVAETVKDFTEVERQQLVMFATENRGNPLYNQKELERRKATALFGDDFAKAVLMPDEDATELAEQSRMQSLELLIIVGQAAEVPVSARDNHVVHIQTMKPAMEKSASEAATKGVQGLEVLHALLSHAEAHVQAAEKSGVNKNELAESKQFVNDLRKAVDKMNALEEDQQRLATAAPAPSDALAAPPLVQ